MPTISHKDLAVFISLLTSKIIDMRRELSELVAIDEDALSDAQLNAQYQLHETIEQYELILGGMGDEYERSFVDGTNLPSFETLTRVLHSSRS